MIISMYSILIISIAVSENIDLFVQLFVLDPENVCFHKYGRGKIPDALFSKNYFKYKNILFIRPSVVAT